MKPKSQSGNIDKRCREKQRSEERDEGSCGGICKKLGKIGEERGEKRTRILDVEKIMKNMGCSLEQALDVLEIKGKDRKAIMGKIQ